MIRELAAARRSRDITPDQTIEVQKVIPEASEPTHFRASLESGGNVFLGRSPAEAVGKLAIHHEATLGLDILRLDLSCDTTDETA
jgi:hypothetical protein